MEKNTPVYQTIDEYIALFPQDVQKKLQELRVTIRSCAPGATEKINYQMPTFFLHGNLIHFAVYKNHIGLYPTPNGIQAFNNELSIYESGKGSVQFPMDKPLPLELVKKIVKFRVDENTKKAAIKAGKRKK